jgi:hypothetical protein
VSGSLQLARLITTILILSFRRAFDATIPRRRRSAYIGDGRDERGSMRQQFLASAMSVALATALATSAMASGHGDRGGFHGGRGFHGGGFHAGHSGFRGTYAGIRGGRLGQGRSGRGFVGGYGGSYYEGIAPFGRAVGFGPGYGTCSPDADGYGSCGSTFTVGW